MGTLATSTCDEGGDLCCQGGRLRASGHQGAGTGGTGSCGNTKSSHPLERRTPREGRTLIQSHTAHRSQSRTWHLAPGDLRRAGWVGSHTSCSPQSPDVPRDTPPGSSLLIPVPNYHTAPGKYQLHLLKALNTPTSSRPCQRLAPEGAARSPGRRQSTKTNAVIVQHSLGAGGISPGGLGPPLPAPNRAGWQAAGPTVPN